MTVTITYDGATPTVGADEDTWGAELNDGALAKIKVDLDALAATPANTIKGNNTGGATGVDDLTPTEVTAMLNSVVGDSGSGGTKGLVPAPAAGDGAAQKLMMADGTWGSPIKAQGLFSGADGATVKARNLSCSRTNVGRYTFTFGAALADDDYVLSVSTSGDLNASFEPYIASRSSGGFAIEVYKNNAGTAAYYDPTHLNVIVLN